MKFFKKKKFVFSNKVYKVYKNEIKSKDFYVKDYLSIDPKNKNKQGFTGVTIVPHFGNKYYLMKAFSPIINKSLLSLPQGFVEKKESLFISARRELCEELGVDKKDIKFSYVNMIYPFSSLINGKMAIFSAQLNKKILTKKKISEIGEGRIQIFTKKKLQLLLNKPIKFDMITFSSLMHFFYNSKHDN